MILRIGFGRGVGSKIKRRVERRSASCSWRLLVLDVMPLLVGGCGSGFFSCRLVGLRENES